jgi:hypothetical protein
MKKRKLIRLCVLKYLAEDTARGVPLARAMRNVGIDTEVTRPVVFRLLEIYKTGEYTDSLQPPWVDQFDSAVQEQPDEYTFEGYFPQGTWVCKI